MTDLDAGIAPGTDAAGGASTLSDAVQALAVRLDAVLTQPALLVGPRPPALSRLTVFADPGDVEALAPALAADGFAPRGAVWARFDVDGALAVDLRPLPAALERAVLLTDASALPGLQHLQRPAADVELVLLATARGARREALVGAESLAALPEQAWQDAAALASTGGVGDDLAALRRAVERAQQPNRTGRPFARVSISGPDGTGKSTQLAQLRAAFESIGVPVAAAWAPTITRVRSYSNGGKRLDAPDGDPAPEAAAAATAPAAPTSSTSASAPGSGGRRRHPVLVEHAWTSLIALRNAAEMWRHVLKAPSGTALLLDRFSLDARVKLEYWYAHRRGLDIAFERRLFGLVAPRADVSVLLVVPIAKNRSRRPEDWSEEQLEVFWRLYLEVADEFGGHVIDGDRAIPEVAADVARTVWASLP